MSVDPGTQIVDAVEHCLEIAQTWLGWDGRPHVCEGGERIYTPHKAVRRIADHLVDHLAEAESLLAGEPPLADGWHGSLVTLDSDWARFTEADLVEAGQRLRRLARTYGLRLRTAGPAEWDAPRGDNWTLRAAATHVCGVTWYAEQVGRLAGSGAR
ncbi:MAG: hypothetical protein DLM59_09475 [Pseudonocardiales bacterium]|nr:MAG: hypothetical protein DLM59_09475 [Pseudonocardiales bacterium]